MARPVILCVDDEPAVAAAVRRDVRARYQADYRVLSATSGADALETLAELKSRDVPVALFLVDQRMPEMSGTEFLERAMVLYPDAKKVLLTAYADTDAAIASINTVGLDQYLMKPWEPPEQMLYPLLDDLLDDWQATAPLPYEGIRVAGFSGRPGVTTSRISCHAIASPSSGSTSRSPPRLRRSSKRSAPRLSSRSCFCRTGSGSPIPTIPHWRLESVSTPRPATPSTTW